MTTRRWSLAACILGLAVIVAVVIVQQQSRPDDDCRLAADVFETWTSLSASLNAMIDAPDGDQATRAAESEEAAVRDIRLKASQISSTDIRARAVDLADALAQIADAQRSTKSSESAEAQYMDGSASAAAAAAGLRKECPSIPRNQQ